MIPSDFELVQACAASYQPGTPYFQPEGFADRLFLTETADYAILAIEGTVDLPMWTGDFLALGVAEHPTTSGNGLPFLHADFYEASLRLLPAVQAVVQRKPVGLTGHSRGAGITAPLAALLIQAGTPPIKVGLFAPPRAGDINLVNLVSTVPVSAYRFGNDPVTEVPLTLMPSFPYEQFILTPIGSPMPDPIKCHAIANYLSAIQELAGQIG